jgi:ribosomal protein L16 Arg81 hydroxylase
MRLIDLLQPYDTTTFLDEDWERRPLLVKGRDAERFSGLFSLADVDRVFATPALVHDSTVRVIRDGRALTFEQIGLRGARGDHAAVEALLDHHRRGSTIALQSVDRVFQPVRELCRVLGAELSATFQANAYLTPPSSQGFDTHFDTHDVFILQISGTKRWNVFESAVKLPLRMSKLQGEREMTGDPLLDVELRAGDLMYIPRGFPHHAVSAESTSLHLTVGAHTVTWAAVMQAALDRRVEGDLRFRQSLPPGFDSSPAVRQAALDRFGELIAALADTADGAAVIDEMAGLARRRQRAVAPGRFLDIEAVAAMRPDTPVRRRAEVDYAIHRDGDRIRLEFNGKAVSIPAFAETEVRHLLAADECQPGRLPGDLDDEGRLVLVRSLVREGLLTISR